MRLAPAPQPLERLGALPFSFHPPISGLEDTEWRYSGCTWDEVLVVDAHSREEIAVPRRFLGALSTTHDCGVVVGLLKELEICDGIARPVQRRVLTMPVRGVPAWEDCPHLSPAAIVPIRLEAEGRSAAARLLLYALALGITGSVLLAYLYRGEIIESHPPVRAASHAAAF